MQRQTPHAQWLATGSLGLVSIATDAGGNLALNGKQEFDPWGAIRAGGVNGTNLNFTGQRRDDTGFTVL